MIWEWEWEAAYNYKYHYLGRLSLFARSTAIQCGEQSKFKYCPVRELNTQLDLLREFVRSSISKFQRAFLVHISKKLHGRTFRPPPSKIKINKRKQTRRWSHWSTNTFDTVFPDRELQINPEHDTPPLQSRLWCHVWNMDPAFQIFNQCTNQR
jgi:hypothetical protein